MRSPLGALTNAAGRALTRPRNQTPAPYVGRGGGPFGNFGVSSATGDPTAALEAMGGNGTLFAIVDQLATATAALDWHMHRKTGDSTSTCEMCGADDDAPRGVTLVPAHPALAVWQDPNRFFTSALFVEAQQQHFELVGEAWWVIAYAGGRPIELWPVRPDRMAPIRDPKTFLSGYVYRAPDGELVPLREDEVVMLRRPAPWDSYRGCGAVQTIMAQLYGAAAAAEWNRMFFANNALPDGIIELPTHLADPQWVEFQDRWAESHRGVRNAHRVGILEHGGKWVETKTTQRDMEFPELRRATREEVREAFAIHGHVLGLSDNVNRANAEAGEYGFAVRHTKPRGERIKDALNGPYLRLFDKQNMGPKAGYSFAFRSPIPQDREGDNAERTSKATTFKTYKDAGVDPKDAAMLAGIPEVRMAPKPEPQPVGAGAGGANDRP